MPLKTQADVESSKGLLLLSVYARAMQGALYMGAALRHRQPTLNQVWLVSDHSKGFRVLRFLLQISCLLMTLSVFSTAFAPAVAKPVRRHHSGLAAPLIISPDGNPQTSSIAPIATDAEVVKPKFTIAIDPGHGGIDPGASSADRVREKDVVLAFGLALKQKLEMTGQFAVVMTRDDDTFIPLQNRARMAREIKADLLIAIHADKLDDPSVRGTTIYTVSEKASDAEAEALAQKENRADIISGMDLGHQKAEVANMLINLAQRESKSQALMFAKQVVNEIAPITGLTSKPMRSAAFVVLKAPDVPSVLVELGYLSNSADKAKLLSKTWRDAMATALTRAVEQHFVTVATAARQ